MGSCKVCGREFRSPSNVAEWPAFLEGMIRHPLEHDRSGEMKRRVEEILSSLWGLSLELAETELAAIFAAHLDELAACGALARVGRDS